MICVKPHDLRAQVARMSPGLTLPSLPSAPIYQRLCDLGVELRKQLSGEGYQPRDLLDVYDFMTITLSPKAFKQIEALKPSKSRSPKGEKAAA
jgi:hypothetical protein